MSDLSELAEEIVGAETVAALTGAGISVPSGVPSFRGEDGVWKRFEEGQFTYGRFRRDPEGFWEDRVELQRTMFGGEYEPNAAHRALARLGADGHLDAIVTQNTDGLHGRAAREVAGDPAPDDPVRPSDESVDGASVIELHGNAQRVRCPDCGNTEASEPIVARVEDGEAAPTCPCGGVYKPDVVLFGEQLPAAALQEARTLARESDVLLAIGSSLVVQPAASLPRVAATAGATVGIVNLEPTDADAVASVVIHDDVTAALPKLRELVETADS